MTPFSNTSCTVAFEGEIQVDVTDASKAKVPPMAFNYDYAWNDPNAAGLTLPPNQAGQTGTGNVYQNLQDGTYQVRVTNGITKCFMDAMTTILKNATPVFTQLVTPTDQVLCSADGKLVVNQVKVIDRNGVVKTNPVDFPISDFVFTYDRTAIGNNVLVNSASTQLDKSNYP